MQRIITEEFIEEQLRKIDSLVEKNLMDKVYLEYIELINILQEKEGSLGKKISKIYVAFAYFLFSMYEYEECIKMFKKAQEYGYESNEEIKKFIRGAFIDPNIEEFKFNYNNNIVALKLEKEIPCITKFENLSFWIIPIEKQNEYYIYDKNEDRIKEKISFNCKEIDENEKIIRERYSDFLILEEYNWNNIYNISIEIKQINKKSYVIINDMEKFLSIIQGILIDKTSVDNMVIFNGIENFKEYFKNNNLYIPRNIIDFKKLKENAIDAIDKIHKYRITKGGRKGDNVLISICIPTYNRGDRAYDNVMHNLMSHYDEELEFVISNNGTSNQTKKDYCKIKEIKDSRLKYFEFEENKGFAINLCKTLEIASGKFILLLSDEDLVDYSRLHLVMNKLIEEGEELGVIRTNGMVEALSPSIGRSQAGENAVLTYMLTSNYMSGIILNNDLLKKYGGIEYVRENVENKAIFYYPHVFWEILLGQYKDIQGLDITLIIEGTARETDLPKINIKNSNKENILIYATFEERLNQHVGFLNIFKDLDICKFDFNILRKMYIKLSFKTIFLVGLAIKVYYLNSDIEILKKIDKTYEFCINHLNEIYDFVYDENHYKDKFLIEKFYNEQKRTIIEAIESYK